MLSSRERIMEINSIIILLMSKIKIQNSWPYLLVNKSANNSQVHTDKSETQRFMILREFDSQS